MVRLDYDSRVTRETLRRLDRFAKDIGDLRRANREAAVQLYSWTLNNFDTEGSLVGGWPALAASTVEQKRRIGKERMMIRSGNLRQGFTSFHTSTDAGVGNQVPYSVYHESLDLPRSRLPRRQLLPDRQTVLDIGVRVYGNHVQRATRKANNR